VKIVGALRRVLVGSSMNGSEGVSKVPLYGTIFQHLECT